MSPPLPPPGTVMSEPAWAALTAQLEGHDPPLRVINAGYGNKDECGLCGGRNTAVAIDANWRCQECGAELLGDGPGAATGIWGEITEAEA